MYAGEGYLRVTIFALLSPSLISEARMRPSSTVYAFGERAECGGWSGAEPCGPRGNCSPIVDTFVTEARRRDEVAYRTVRPSRRSTLCSQRGCAMQEAT